MSKKKYSLKKKGGSLETDKISDIFFKNYNETAKSLQENNVNTGGEILTIPSYPNKLQVLPLQSHNNFKESDNSYNMHLKELENMVDNVKSKIKQQSYVVNKEQELLNMSRNEKKKEEIRTNNIIDNKSYEMTKFTIENITAFLKTIKDLILKLIDIFFKFINSEPLVLFFKLIFGIIAAVIFVFLIIYLIFGSSFNFSFNSNNNYSFNNNEKINNSNGYSIGGEYKKCSWYDIFSDPIKCTNNFISNKIKLPSNVIHTIKSSSNGILNTFTGTSINDKYKFERPVYMNESGNILHRIDNVTVIDSKYLNKEIKEEFFGSDVKNKSISILKPKNIEWEFSYLDYNSDTDAGKLPEQIKNYKNVNDKESSSLNDTKKIVFPWKYNIQKGEFIVDCNSKFLNNKDTNMYMESTTDNKKCISKEFNYNKDV
jgi:hypothetical protein